MSEKSLVPPQPTLGVVQCPGRDDRFANNPVQAVVMLVPQPDGSWKKVITCPKKSECKRKDPFQRFFGYCELELD